MPEPPYNNNVLFNFDDLLKRYPDLIIKPSIDTIKISFEYTYATDVLKSLCNTFGNCRTIKSGYVIARQFFTDNVLMLTFEPARKIFKKDENGKTSFMDPHWQLITLHEPTEEFQRKIYECFDLLGIQHKLSLIEIAFDFYTESKKLFMLKERIEESLFHKHKRAKAGRCKSTTYSSPRKSAKNIKAYYRPKNKTPEFVRLELKLTRNILKRHNIQFPIQKQQINLAKYFDFRKIDKKRLVCSMLKKLKEKGLITSDPNKRPSKYRDAIIKAFLDSSINEYFQKETISKGHNGELIIISGSATLMEAIENIRTNEKELIRNPNQFIIEPTHSRTIDILNLLWRSAESLKVRHSVQGSSDSMTHNTHCPSQTHQ